MNSVTKTIRKWAAFKRLRTVVASMSLFVCLLPSVVNSQDIFFNPGLDQQSINPNSIAGGPVLWLQARPEYFGTTGARSFDGEQYVELASKLLSRYIEMRASLDGVNIKDSDGVQYHIRRQATRAASLEYGCI
jgi:hypothetical protein